MKNKKSPTIKTLSLLLAIIILAFSSQSVMAISTISEIKEKEERLSTVIENKIIELKESNTDLHPDEGEVEVSILNTKKIYDMDGNVYTLTECEPTGYMIFHEESGIFVESSLKAISPYIGLEDELYYFGIGEYYQKLDSDFVHTILDKKISIKDSDALIEISQEINSELVKNKDVTIINYINGNEDMVVKSNNVTYSTRTTSTYKGMTCVDGYKFFTLLKSCGNNQNGTCGYIAAAMLLSYYQRYYGGDLVPQKYLSYTCESGGHAYSINNNFHKLLVSYGEELGYGNSTTSNKIKNVINEYLKDQGVKKEYEEGIIPFNNNFTIAGSIDNGHPVIWFGLVNNNSYNEQTNITHAIVVYGYYWEGLIPSYVAHFGWNGANEVYFTGILGSLFAFTSNTWTYV